MEALVASAHLIGAVAAVVTMVAIGIVIGWWEEERNRKRWLDEASAQLGVAIRDLDNEEVAPRVLRFASERASSELFRNRLSDLCGTVRVVWGWLGWSVQIAILVGVLWYTLTDSLGAAVYAWSIVPVFLLFGTLSLAFSLVCRFATGRYPGQAEAARQAIANIVRNERAQAADGAIPAREAASGGTIPVGIAAAQILEALPASVSKASRAAFDGTSVQFLLSGDGGGEWYLDTRNGHCTLVPGRHVAPTVTVAMDAADYVAMALGELKGADAFAAGKLKLAGDMAIASRMGELFGSPGNVPPDTHASRHKES
jgi:putative sterol carrier protein